jgi:hypothetical protein
MDYRLTVLAGIVAAAITASDLPAQSSRKVSLTPLPVRAGANTITGAELMDRVVRRISDYSSISAKIRHRSELFGPSLIGSGAYLQSRQDERLQVRFSLSVKTDDRLVSLLHVCDGRTLWMFDNLDGQAELSRVDLARLRQASAGEGGATMPILLGGGLPQLLGSLKANFDVAAPQSVVFQDVPVWALALRWKPDRLAKLLSRTELFDDTGQLRTDRLPGQMPDRIFLLVGQDDLFPYHIDYRRSVADDVLSSVAASKQSASRSLTTMELFEVQFNAPLDPMWFVYKPGNIKIVDQTDKHLAQLKQLELPN